MRSTNDETGDREALRRRLQRWRQRHGGRGRRIPQALWAQAATLARREGIGEVARALRLDARQLARRAEVAPTDAAPADASSAFLELAAAELATPVRSTVEVTNAAGERLRIELAGHLDIAALMRAFRESR